MELCRNHTFVLRCFHWIALDLLHKSDTKSTEGSLLYGNGKKYYALEANTNNHIVTNYKSYFMVHNSIKIIFTDMAEKIRSAKCANKSSEVSSISPSWWRFHKLKKINNKNTTTQENKSHFHRKWKALKLVFVNLCLRKWDRCIKMHLPEMLNNYIIKCRDHSSNDRFPLFLTIFSDIEKEKIRRRLFHFIQFVKTAIFFGLHNDFHSSAKFHIMSDASVPPTDTK